MIRTSNHDLEEHIDAAIKIILCYYDVVEDWTFFE